MNDSKQREELKRQLRMLLDEGYHEADMVSCLSELMEEQYEAEKAAGWQELGRFDENHQVLLMASEKMCL